MNVDRITSVAVLLSIFLLSGCGGDKLYRTTLPSNLTVSTIAKSMTATLNIHSVDTQCNPSYLGTIKLNSETTDLGIPTNKPVHLVVGFSSTSFLRSSSTYSSYDILIVPRPEYRYEMAVRYVDNIYNVEVFEVNRNTGERQEVGGKGIQNCRD
jgi:hypothetical protein